MGTILGNVSVAETGVGIANVVVVALGAGSPPQRLGSVLTDAAGNFQIQLAVAASPATGLAIAAAPASLRVAVFADAATGDLTQALYLEPTARSPAAATESYAIRISQDKLVAAAIPVALRASDPSLVASAQYAFGLKVGVAADQLTANAGRSIIDASRTPLQQFTDQIRNELANYGRPFSGDLSGANVQSRLLSTIRNGLTSQFGTKATRVGRMTLSASEATALHNVTASDGTAPATSVEPLLFGDPGATVRMYTGPWLAACRDPRMPATKCDGSGGSNGTSGGGNGTPPTPTIENAVWQALSTTALINGTRPAPGDVARRVDGLQLGSGPADVTAIHDFEVLHLAFDNVWGDLVDEDAVSTAVALRQAVLRAGGTQTAAPPAAGPATSGRAVALFGLGDALGWVVGEAVAVLQSLSGGGGGNARPAGSVIDHRGGVGAPPPQGSPTPSPTTPVQDVQNLLDELQAAINEPYRFTVFASDSSGVAINFGLIVTYRQRWQPVTYQAGKLVSTITLAPSEERTYSRKVVTTTKKKVDTKETFRSLTRSEDSVTARAVRDIVETASDRTGFEAGASAKVYSAKVTQDDARTSSDTKQSFREEVRRATSEYESNRSMEVSYETSTEITTQEGGKLVNPNSELAVTYLFYELQRRFLVSERIQQITPVVLVAQPVPKPSDIDVKWLLQYDWILRRALLDSSFEDAFKYLTEDLIGEEFSVSILKRQVDAQQIVVDKLTGNLALAKNDVQTRYAALQRALTAGSDANGGMFAFLDGLAQTLFGKDFNADTAQLREQMARDAYDRAEDTVRDLEDQLKQEATLLSTMTDKWVTAQKSYLDKTVDIDRLRLHVKQNILYYMHAIWDHEPPDQRYFRLHQVPVPVLSGNLTYSVVADNTAIPMPPDWVVPTEVQAKANITADGSTVPLVQVADLDNPLGYKGNYMVFPLTEQNIVTQYMMVPYVNAASGIQDPDQVSNLTRAELDEYVCCLKKNMAPADLDTLLPGINAAYARLLSDPRLVEEEIVVPTDSLYIEALPSPQPVLEDFQLMHRAADVEKVLVDNARAQLDNVRRAARILKGDLADPEIDRKVLVEGTSSVSVGDA